MALLQFSRALLEAIITLAQIKSESKVIQKYICAHHNACNSFPLWDPVGWPSRSTSPLLSSAPEWDKLNTVTINAPAPLQYCTVIKTVCSSMRAKTRSGLPGSPLQTTVLLWQLQYILVNRHKTHRVLLSQANVLSCETSDGKKAFTLNTLLSALITLPWYHCTSSQCVARPLWNRAVDGNGVRVWRGKKWKLLKIFTMRGFGFTLAHRAMGYILWGYRPC